jgi:hypothetical protein
MGERVPGFHASHSRVSYPGSLDAGVGAMEHPLHRVIRIHTEG